MLTKILKAGLLSFVVLGTPIKAYASEVTELFSVTATNLVYTSFGGASAPPAAIDPMKVSFTITFDASFFDPSQSYPLTSTGISLVSANVPHPLPLSYQYIGPINNGAAHLYVGTYSPGLTLDTGFDLALAYFNNTFSLDYARYITPGGEGIYADSSGSGTVSASAISATPLPAALPMFGTLIASLVAFSMWRSRKASV